MDPQLRAFLDRANAAGPFDPSRLPLDEALRLFRAQAYAPPPTGLEGVSVEDRMAEAAGRSVPVRIYLPTAGRPAGAVLNIHGGGFVGGSLALDDHRCAFLAREASCGVISVDYGLAPERPFPGGLEDCKAVFDWTQGVDRPVWLDPAKVGVMGSSAGGSLGLSTCLMARDAGGPRPAWLVLLYPVVDDDLTRPSYRRYDSGYNLTAAQMRWFIDQYRAAGADDPGSYAAPLRAASFADLPPTLVLSAELDVLADEIAALTRRLQDCGALVAATVFGDTIHGFVSIARESPPSRLALNACAAFIVEMNRSPDDPSPARTSGD